MDRLTMKLLFSRKTPAFFLLILLALSLFSTFQVHGQSGSITFKPDILDGVEYGIEDYSFFFRYGQYYMTFRPYFQWNGQIVNLRQAKQYIDNNFPNARYSHIAQKLQRSIHWGFNYTNLPDEIQQNLEAIYFKLEDYNFPLSVVELETYELTDSIGGLLFNAEGKPKNGTRIHIPQINLSFDFYDIISQDFDVTVNKTGIAIYNVNGKQDLFLDPITYSAPTITVTGYTSGTPCTPTDLYNADVAGGWGVVFMQGSKQFYINANLNIGDFSTLTYFKTQNNEHIEIRGTADVPLKSTTNSNFISGNIDGNGNVYGGSCIFVSTSYSTAPNCWSSGGVTGDIYLYDTQIRYSGFWRIYGTSQIVQIKGCIINAWGGGRLKGASSYIKDTFIHDGTTYALNLVSPNPTVQNVVVTRSAYALYWYPPLSNTFTVREITARNNTYAFFIFSDSWDYDAYAIDCDIDNWSFSWSVSSGTSRINRQYSFDLTVTYPNGTAVENANVTLTKGAAELTDTTDASGQIDTKTLTKGYYNQANGNTIQDAGDWTLSIVSTAGNYTSTFPINEKTSWTIAVEIPTASGGEYTQADLDEWFVIGGFLAAIIVGSLMLALYLTKINVNKNDRSR